MLIAKLETCITHGFIGVFVDEDENGVNDWTQEHTNQGFSWRRNSVSFCTGGDGGLLNIEIEISTELQLREDAKRIIQVPFDVDIEQVVVADVANYQDITVPVGKYALVFQHNWQYMDLKNDFDMWCVFSFVPEENAQPKILRADDQIVVPDAFVMEAEKA